jgi:PAS domain-containing protein
LERVTVMSDDTSRGASAADHAASGKDAKGESGSRSGSARIKKPPFGDAATYWPKSANDATGTATASDAVAILGADRGISYCNPAFAPMINATSPSEVRGLLMDQLLAADDPTASTARHHNREICRSPLNASA